MLKDRRAAGFADQLTRAAGKISSTLCEGYSRETGKGRALYYEYALGSSRECRDWYYKSRRLFRAEVLEHRMNLCTQVIRLCLKMVENERRTNRRVVTRS